MNKNKTMKKLFLAIFMVVFTFSLACAKESEEKGLSPFFRTSIIDNSYLSADSLLGEFSLKPNGKERFLRVLKEKGNYYFQIKEKGEWSKKELLTLEKKEPTEKELKDMKELLGENFKKHTQSVMFIGIFFVAVKTKKNQKINDKYTCKTGYYIFSLFGGYSDLYKVKNQK